jgi:hypothetical protein
LDLDAIRFEKIAGIPVGYVENFFKPYRARDECGSSKKPLSSGYNINVIFYLVQIEMVF